MNSYTKLNHILRITNKGEHKRLHNVYYMHFRLKSALTAYNEKEVLQK